MKLEQQLRQLSFSGLAAALLLMVVPQQAFAMHIMEGLFTASVGAGLVVTVFTLLVVWTGALTAYCAGG
ncbi:cobalamin biosynthesis protein [Salmonella enterica subsp. enterica]|uniref:Cobalamin biosynthesis protein n=1 Tax=Salmonella enterica I TaxID=59201 RepID=A0A379WR74_SALET|nr:cobalamin biosynthesis protein [Salmonella enterica subsp. enterica]